MTFNPNDTTLAVALGGLTEGLTLNSLTDAYRTFAAGGLYSKGKYVREIIDSDGKTVYKDKGSMQKRAISEDNAYLMTEMLQKCAKIGTAKQVGYAACDAAAKREQQATRTEIPTRIAWLTRPNTPWPYT